MVSILRQGNEAIRERIRLMAIYSEEAVRAGRRANDAIERGEKIFYRETVGAAFGTLGGAAQSMEMRSLISKTKQELGIGSGGAEVQNINPTKSELADMNSKQMAKFTEALLKNAAGKGINAQDVADFFKRKSETQAGQETRTISARLASFAQLSAVEEENLKKKQLGESRFLSSATPVLAASSLQQIGGGDVSSVTTGLLGNSIENNTRRTADATEKIANKETTTGPSRAALVNKAK
jgi:hypothetical protein